MGGTQGTHPWPGLDGGGTQGTPWTWDRVPPTWDGVPPLTWDGVPPQTWDGVPLPEMEYPLPEMGMGYPPTQGPPHYTEQHSKHLLHGRQCASCIHTGGLSCFTYCCYCQRIFHLGRVYWSWNEQCYLWWCCHCCELEIGPMVVLGGSLQTGGFL